MKKINSYLWCIMFLCVLIAPSISFQALEGYIDTGNYEKRELAAKPVLQWSTYQEYPSAYEEYYNDNLPYRNQLISLNSWLQYTLLHESSSEGVVVGKEGWLFYKSQNNMENYKGTDLFSEEQLRQAADNCIAVRDYLSEKNCEFVLFIAPNKERIYSQYLPAYYQMKNPVSRAQQVVSYLREHTDIRVVYPEKELLEASRSYDVYYHLDTHWNRLGGYIGTKALLEELGIPCKEVGELTLREDNFSNFDLANQLNLQNYLDSDVDYTVEGYTNNAVDKILADHMTVYEYQSNAEHGRNFFMVRDSFGGNMAQFLAANFAFSYMPHQDYFTWEQVEERKPDIFVEQFVERNLDKLLTMTVE